MACPNIDALEGIQDVVIAGLLFGDDDRRFAAAESASWSYTKVRVVIMMSFIGSLTSNFHVAIVYYNVHRVIRQFGYDHTLSRHRLVSGTPSVAFWRFLHESARKFIIDKIIVGQMPMVISRKGHIGSLPAYGREI